MEKKAGRRLNGEGSLTRRKDGTWQGQYTSPTAGGGKKRRYVYAKTKALCNQKLKAALKEVEAGVTQDPITLGEYLRRWLEDSVKNSVSVRTYERYEQNCRVHLVPTLGGVKLKDLKPLPLQTLYREKLDEGLSPRTVQYIHRTLYKALKQAVRWSLLTRNVAECVEAPKPLRKEITPLSPEEVGVLLDGLDGPRDVAFHTLAVSTGMRQGELLGLRWKDLDLEAGVVKIRRSLSRTDTQGFIFVQPKSAKGKRSVGLVPRTVKALEAYRGADNPHGEDLVFPNRDGNPMSPWMVTRRFQSLCKGLGLPAETRFHDLRHTAATIWLLKGIHPKIVQEALGHSTISITLDTYSHVLPNMQEGAIRAMGEVLGDAEPVHQSYINLSPSGES